MTTTTTNKTHLKMASNTGWHPKTLNTLKRYKKKNKEEKKRVQVISKSMFFNTTKLQL